MSNYANHGVYVAIDMDGLLNELPDDDTWKPDPKTGIAPWEEPGSTMFASAMPQQKGLLLGQVLNRHANAHRKDPWTICVLTKLHPDLEVAVHHADQKIQWLKAHLPSTNLVFCPPAMTKADRFRSWLHLDTLDKRCVLIDDYAKNIEEWEAEGGFGILWHPSIKTVRENKNLTRIGERASAEEVCRMIEYYTKDING